ncbi:monosaccharide ABC transporter substrate-binding protein, CUT2 family [Desulforamulus reducens MI-1]|uniref:Monosaccharide ABC transporter substrate-binding protein, CUT2 family n=1 Tax=Desulforamulus reducens (strain ATCC BAA-1160 / DSM 100696 / MI-1) TaxID=349161 RepID=A4J4K0_DESRM|nr:substrate-binding domain-containing protein [Desulforamulus reducens]ABO50003.1 monosaccharide ABC transporter substrate-binding protein, CUT2 family [Desulforamulus reducens MI-1]
MNNPTYKRILSMLLICSLVFVAGCPGKEAQPKPETQKKIKIGVSLAAMEFDGNKIIKKFMQERSKKEKVQLIWLDAKMDPSQQEKDVDKLIQQKVKAIILQTVDPKEGAKLVDKIVQAKIKVIGLETLPYNAPLDGYVASDHTRAGELQGKFILNQVSNQNSGGQKQGQSQQGNQSSGEQSSQSSEQTNQQQGAKSNIKILFLKGDPMDPVAQMIVDGARSVLGQSKNVEKMIVEEHPEGDPQMAQMTVMNTLQEGSVDAILATDDRLAEAAMKALKAENMTQKILTVGVGADQKTSQALANGDHDAEIDIMPEHLANSALDAALDIAEKGNWNNDTVIQNGNFDIPAKIIPVRLIDQEQVQLLTARWGDLKKEEKKSQEQQGQGQQQGSSEGNSSQGGSEGESGQGGGGQGNQGKKTKVKIVTQDGKVMEVEVDGEIKKIEQGAGGEKGQEGQQQGSQGGGGQGGQ